MVSQVASVKDQHHHDVVDLHFLLGLLKARKWVVIVLVAICVVLGGAYALTRPAIYQSTALIKINTDTGANASNLAAALGMSGAASAGGVMNATPAQVETVLLQSHYILEQVADDLGLSITITPKYSSFLGHLWGKFFPSSDSQSLHISRFHAPPSLQSIPLVLSRKDNATDYVLSDKGHHVLLSGKVGELAVSDDETITLKIDEWNVDAQNEFFLEKKPLEAIADSLLQNLDVQEEGDGTGILEIRYKSTDPKQAQDILNSILRVAVNADIAEKAAEATKTLEFLQHQLPQITQDLDVSEKRLNTYRSQTGTLDDKLQSTLLIQEMTGINKSLDELNIKKLELLENFTEEHPFLIAINQKQKKMEQQLTEVKSKLKKLSMAMQESGNFQRDIEVHGSIYSGVMQNVQQMEMLKGGTISSLRVLQEASLPSVPAPSQLGLIMLVSMITGLFLSFALLLLHYSLSKSLDPLFLEKFLGVQIFGVIGYSVAQAKLSRKMNADKHHHKRYLLSLAHPKDAAVEALRSLRTALKLASVDKKIVAISGCNSGVGKSFVISNLAVLLANTHKKVLLIDADMRRGYTHRVFAGHRSLGLSEYLEQKSEMDAVIQKILPNLDFIASGLPPTYPAELLMNGRLNDLLSQAKDAYDFILIDTPPVLAVTDATIIFKSVDLRLLLVSLNNDQLRQIELAHGMISKTGSSIDGLICNHLRQSSDHYAYQNYYAAD